MDEIQILFAITVLYFTYRWWSSSGPSTSGASPSSGSGSGSSSASSSGSGTAGVNAAAQRFNFLAERIPNDAVAQATAMFPQLGEREIRWEFVRTGRVRSLEVVVQALLEERPQTPIIPAGFLEPVPPPPLEGASSATTGSAASSSIQKSKHESLIERLGLQKQVEKQDTELSADGSGVGEVEGKGKGTARSIQEEWKSLSMQERKERMVLDARRRIIEKDRAKRQ